MWTKIDDRSNYSAKLNSLSDAALRLWFIVLVDSRRAEKLWLGGRVPRDTLTTIVQYRWRGSRLERLVTELVEARAGGRSGLGLWEVTEDGWQIHDWEQYGPDRHELGLTPSDVGRLGGKASAAARRRKHGSAVPVGARNRTEPEPNRFEQPVREPVRATSSPTGTEPTEPPDPDPDLNKTLSLPAVPVRLVLRLPEARKGRISAEELDEALAVIGAEKAVG